MTDREKSEMIKLIWESALATKERDMKLREELNNLSKNAKRKKPEARVEGVDVSDSKEKITIKGGLYDFIERYQKIYNETENLWKDLYNFRETPGVFRDKEIRSKVEQAYRDTQEINISTEKIIKYLKGE